MLVKKFGRVLAAAAALLFLGTPAHAIDPLPADAKMVADPAVMTGKFANGLSYAIMRNGEPAGAISIRLAVKAGSYDEEESELGYAHFIEHMAFRSTKQAPQGSLDTRFAALGVAFGRDENAATGLETTMYQMDLPHADNAAVKTVLEWLRGAADGILFTPAAVDIERGVVLAELRARNSPMAIASDKTSDFQAPELRSFHRDPGGTEASLNAATAAGLQKFYDRWYRPENAVIVIVGDAAPEEMLKAAEAAFGSWTARGAPAPRAKPAVLAPRGLDSMTLKDPTLPLAESACRIAPQDGPRDSSLETIRPETLSQIWVGILSTRSARSLQKPGSALLGAAPIVNRSLPDARLACLIAVPNAGKWREGLAEAQGEFRRFAENGPTATEVETVTEQLRSRLRAVIYMRATRSTRDLAQQIAEAQTSGRPFTTPEEAMRVYDLIVAGITPADVKAAFDTDWTGTGPLLVMTGPGEIPKEMLAAAWRENEGAKPLESFADAEAAQWPYWQFGKRGKVKGRETFPEFTRLTFKNGVVFNFKQTDFQSGGVEIRVRFGHGERAMKPDERMPMTLATTLFPSGGLGKIDYAQIGLALANTTWGFTLEAQPTTYVLKSSTLSDNVDQQMRLLAAYMTDPGFRPLLDEKLPTAIELAYQASDTDPAQAAFNAFEHAAFPGRESMPPREQMSAYRAADFERMLKPQLLNSPIEVTIVGDIGEAAATLAVAQTFGALPPRPKLAPAPTGRGPFRDFPAALPGPIAATHRGPPDKAATLLVWPLYVASPARRQEEYSLLMLRSIFEARLLQRVRVVMGKVYAPSVGMDTPDNADQGRMFVMLEATPSDVGALAEAARSVASELAGGAITQSELDDARTPLLARGEQALRDNDGWASLISYTTRDPAALDELTALRPSLEKLTLDDVRRAAATWLTPTPIVVKALPAGR
ncbi:MAG: M16 family metallopeptidase [Allosphingosinicella sp.]